VKKNCKKVPSLRYGNVVYLIFCISSWWHPCNLVAVFMWKECSSYY
jgi:hypothetical protein